MQNFTEIGQLLHLCISGPKDTIHYIYIYFLKLLFIIIIITVLVMITQK